MKTVEIPFGFFACLLVNVHAANDPDVSVLAKIAEEALTNTSINACDETNTNNSFIYCYGRLLAAVNVHNLFQDSKSFVDMPLKFDPEVIQEEFNRRFGEYELQAINRSALQAFVDENFESAGNELEDCQLEGWNEHPPKLMKIQDSMLRDWALKLNAIWKLLCRKMKPNQNPKRTSLIHIPEEFIVPGGRFREFYYWDAYWIVKGLAASGLHSTIKKMITNFVTVVDRYGFIPNGGRIYYLGRSQPPLLIPMVYEYYELTRDLAFVNKILPTLIREYEFWQNNRVINVSDDKGNTFSVFHYHSKCNVPRPESFLADIIHASRLPAHERPKFYMNIASGAESGWDFSSRWLKDGHKIETIETTDIIPIDLNAFICWNLDILQYLLRNTGNPLKSKTLRDKREILRQAMFHVFYNDTEGAWFDYNLRTKSHNFNFYPSIVVPLFGECYQPLNLARPQQIVNYLNKMGVYNYPGGVPTSLIKDTKQQWDFPNGWSPTNHMIIEGMRKSSNPVVQEQAYRLAKKWVLGNFKVFQETGHMWEKYDVNGTAPQPGSGGEYLVQDGFGWSNGVILDLLTTYHERMRIEPGDLMPNNNASATNNNGSTTGSASERMHSKSITPLIPIIISILYTYLLTR
ncbi:trehalase [Loa loa]|uniref:Trehalase n=1 Tax=Loa loa TaxID=7209 RepID=A0A1I7VX12_LOALO|nr:trehalase [Loa loa]EFO18250.1 trehalase [Loa loa]